MTTQKTKNLIKMFSVVQESVEEMDTGDSHSCSVNKGEYHFPIDCSSINCFECPLLVGHKNEVQKISEIINK